VFDIGADYPMIESAPPNSNVPNPQLTGNGGTADITTGINLNDPTFTE
jgi:hypothetical protein